MGPPCALLLLLSLASPASSASSSTVEWVSLPGGSFTMGADSGRANEKPAHPVSVKPFDIARSEVTYRQYQACVSAGACLPLFACAPSAFEGDDQPVVCADWSQAKAFCAWVGGRLPSEAEWEYAARSAGKARDYPWGSEPADCRRAVMFDEEAGCGREKPWPVCSKPAGNTEQGLCDMSGNVWEWTEDLYHETYQGAPSDGSAWLKSGGPNRVLRGGSWDRRTRRAQVTSRMDEPPGIRLPVIGFRPVRSRQPG